MTDPRLDFATHLHPANAVAAIVAVDGSYLLQLRDSKRGIFFPAQWGCFGGGVDPGETPEAAIVREMREELTLALPIEAFRYFTKFDFDLGFCGMTPIWRVFYEVTLTPRQVDSMILREGAAMRLFAAEDILLGAEPLTPYDSFALWFHINRSRLRA
jgi:8-oxo-dGTP pyrophosphatase MutT (NUDIX family)